MTDHEIAVSLEDADAELLDATPAWLVRGRESSTVPRRPL
jgi:hypothetical protein